MFCDNCMANVEGMLTLDKKVKCEYCGKRFDGNPNPLMAA